MLEAGECHSASALIVHVPAEKTLFAGDLVWNGYHPNISGGATFRWITALAHIERYEIDPDKPDPVMD